MESRHGGNINEMAEKYQIAPQQLTDFSANINPFGMPTNVKKKLIEAIGDLERYPDNRYFLLTKAIAEFHDCSEKWVYLGNGAAQVIFELAQSLSVQNVLLLAPTFMEYETAFARKKCNFSYYFLEKNDFQLEINQLIALAKEKQVDCICLCNPNNPTGQIILKADLLVLVSFCEENRVELIIDEAFMDFVELASNYSLISELENNSHLYVIRSLTKIFALPGLRLGYLLTGNEVLLKKLISRRVPWSINTFADKAGQVALKETEYLERTIDFITQERAFLVENLRSYSVFRVYDSVTNFLFFRGNCAFNLQHELMKKNYLIRSCQNFNGLSANYYRIAVRTKEENKAFVRAIKELLNEKGGG